MWTNGDLWSIGTWEQIVNFESKWNAFYERNAFQYIFYPLCAKRQPFYLSLNVVKIVNLSRVKPDFVARGLTKETISFGGWDINGGF